MKATLTKENITAVKSIANKKLHTFGFSLIEVIVVIIIIAASCNSFIYLHNNSKNNQQAKIIIDSLKDNLIYAKHYAIKNKTNIFICPSNNMLNCDSNWHQGYIVFSNDDNNNNNQTTKLKIIKHHKFAQNLNKFSLNLYMFGNSSISNHNILKISKDSTTFNNGHFLYMDSKNTKYIYWNKQLKFYTK